MDTDTNARQPVKLTAESVDTTHIGTTTAPVPEKNLDALTRLLFAICDATGISPTEFYQQVDEKSHLWRLALKSPADKAVLKQTLPILLQEVREQLQAYDLSVRIETSPKDSVGLTVTLNLPANIALRAISQDLPPDKVYTPKKLPFEGLKWLICDLNPDRKAYLKLISHYTDTAAVEENSLPDTHAHIQEKMKKVFQAIGNVQRHPDKDHPIEALKDASLDLHGDLLNDRDRLVRQLIRGKGDFDYAKAEFPDTRPILEWLNKTLVALEHDAINQERAQHPAYALKTRSQGQSFAL